MPKTKISEYSTTNSDNTDIESINIAEGCAPSGINNAIRELMVHLKEFQTGASGDAFTFAGGVLISGTANTITGNVLMSGTNTITGSTTATFAAGAVGTPSIAAHGDTNTGIFFPAADTIAFAEGGVEAMRIDSSGNLGLGVTPNSIWSSAKAMQINGIAIMGDGNAGYFSANNYYNGTNWIYRSSAAANLYEIGNGQHKWSTAPSGTAGNAITFTQAMTLDASGNLGIGTTSPTIAKLHISGDLVNNYGIRLQSTTGTGRSWGFYAQGNNSEKFAFKDITSNADVYVIDSSGNVGIGTSSPTQRLQVVNSAGDSTVLVSSTVSGATGSLFMRHVYGTATYMGMTSATGDYGLLFSFAGTALGVGTFNSVPLLFGTANTERMRITSSGNVGIGTSSPNSKLVVSNGGAAGLEVEPVLRDGSTVGASFLSYNRSGAAFVPMQFSGADLRFATSDTERARITSGGDLLVGTTTSNGKLTVYYSSTNTGGVYSENGAASPGVDGAPVFGNLVSVTGTNAATAYIFRGRSAGADRFYVYGNGGVGNYSANDVNLASDQRLKKDISPLTTTWDKVKAIEVVNFRYKDCNENDPLLYGVIAQQVQPIVPELVVVTQEAKEAVEAKEALLDEEGNVVEPAVVAKEATPEYFGIREQPMYWLAIKALQEAMTRIEALEAEVAALKSK